MLQEIKSWITGKILFSVEAPSLKIAVELAVRHGVSLSDSDLRGSNLSGSDLRGSDLRDSDLSGSDLSDSDLSGSDLGDSDLRGSNLRDSNLRGSNLRDSNLRGSNLSGSDLRGSNLSGSNLCDSNLSGSKEDFFAILDLRPGEVDGLKQALIESRVDGSCYEGECACLLGTIANIAHCKYSELNGLVPDSNRPAERWFLAINPTMSRNHPIVKITLDWIAEWETTQASKREAAESK